MKYILLKRFTKQLENFSISTQKKFWNQLDHLLNNFYYPSLQLKKYDESRGIWQGRVDRKVRFYFLIEDDTCILLNIKKHPK